MTSSRSSLSCTVEKVPLTNGPIATADGATAIKTFPAYHGCVRVGCYIYITGQIRQLHGNYEHVMPVLDINAKTWNFIPYEKYVNEEAGVFLYQDKLVIFNRVTKYLTRFDLAMNEWSHVNTDGENPSPGSYYSGDFLEKLSRYVLFGGYPAHKSKRVYILDVPQNRWFKAVEKGTPAPTRFQHGSCVHNGLIYIYGGWGPKRRYNDGLFILKVGRDRSVTWSSALTAHMGTLISFVFIPVGRTLFLLGGMTERGVSGISYYDTDRQEFGKVEVLPQGRTFIGTGAAGELIGNGRSIAIFGGQNSLEAMVQISVNE